MKTLLRLALFLILLVHSPYWASSTPETKDSPCEPENVTREHKTSFERMQHASSVLFKKAKQYPVF